MLEILRQASYSLINVTISALLLLAIGCSSNKDTQQPQDFSNVARTSVENLQQVVDPRNTIISSVAAMDILPNGNLAILDSDQKKVMLFHPDGTRYNAFGSNGKGPGEFVTPRGLDIHNSTIRILDVELMRVNQYSKNGQFIQNYDTEPEASFFGFVAPGDSMEYYTVANGYNGSLVGYHNATTDSVGYFGDAIIKNPPPVNDQKAFKTSAANGEIPKPMSNDLLMDYAEGSLYAFLKAHSRLQKYRGGQLLWDIKINHPANQHIFDRYIENVQSGPSAFALPRYIDGMKATQNNVYLLWNSNPQTIVQVSKKGEIQQVYELPAFKERSFSALAVDPDTNRLYLSDYSNAQVFAFLLN